MTGSFPSFPTPLPPARRTRSGWIIVGVVLLVVAGASLAWWQQRAGNRTAEAVTGVSLSDSSVRAPAGERVQVRVVNATATRGLARRATLMLRDFGYDVVDFDTDARRRRETTIVQVHTGKTEVASRLQRVMGARDTQSTQDSLRYLDFTILIGSDWKPPAQPLRP